MSKTILRLFSRAAVAGGTVYVGSDSGTLFAIKATTGKKVWSVAFGGPVESSPAVSGGVVYVTSTNGELFALTAARGAKRKEVTGFGAFGSGTFAAIGGVVFAGLDDKKGTVVAVDMTSGKTLWRKVLGPATFSPYVAAAGGTVFAGTVGIAGGKLYALDPKTGGQLWSAPVSGGVNEGPVAADGAVYTGGGDLDTGILQAWEPATGKPLWSYTTKDSMGRLTVVPGSRVYFGSGGYVYSVGA